MHPLFLVPELLIIVFRKLKRLDQVHCTLVCKLWSEIALDILWNRALALELLANLLAPVKRTSSSIRMIPNIYSFGALLDEHAWSRFHSMYSSRVRTLCHFSPFSDSDLSDFSSIFQEIEATRPVSLPILPELRVLEWRSDPVTFQSSIFMHDKIKKFITVAIDESQNLEDVKISHLRSLSRAISTRMPFLTFLEVELYPRQEYVASLVVLLNNLSNLTHFGTSAFDDISPILSCSGASRLQSLKLFAFVFDKATRKSGGPFPEGNYPARLGNLAVCVVKYSAITPFFQHHDLVYLKTINIKTFHVEKPVSVRLFFHILSRSCPALAFVYVAFCNDDYWLRDDEVSPPAPNEEIVTFDDMKTMLNCKNIADFLSSITTLPA
ncbi:hypothetical protein D9758_008701 [Tetrapyrgos nigripes]|uniref:F-box domain-containing protein n=1 Tax=Tetrapyrgos nigripes TaxID=182062 RepID=A0A8H5FY65_9AGAR|nr:hypothetical protein D9758_008701 [Tetrapyrgos nigripes]